MSVRHLEKIFQPQRIVVIGASNKPGSVGFSVFRNLIGSRFKGVVYPVNPKHESIQGIHAYRTVADLPRTPDLAVICTPAATVPDLVSQCGAAGIWGVIVISAGFHEAGETGRELEQQLRAEAEKFPGLRILGPNCLGIIVPGMQMNASFGTAMPKAGNVAFISQSGALCTSVLDWALEEGIGFSYFVSVGNMIDVSFADLIDFFGEDPQTRSIILYIESITDAREFISAARAFGRTKPIVAYKAGRFAESAKAATSHTGALAGEDAVYDAAFERAGIVRVYEIDDIFDCAELLARQKPPQGDKLAIITNAGGPGVMATDSLIERQGHLAPLTEQTFEQLDRILPPSWSHGNPIDILGDAPPERFAQATEIVLKDATVDAALIILTPQAMTDPTETARALGGVLAQSHDPVLAAWMGGREVAEGIRILNREGIPTYSTPEHAVRAFMVLVRYARDLELMYETPRDIPIRFRQRRERAREVLYQIPADGTRTLSEDESKQLLAAYGIPIVETRIARSADEAVTIAREIGFPVVLKVLSPQITHKTDVDGVQLNLRNEAAVRSTYRQIEESVRLKRPDALMKGVTVQKMISLSDGYELILGAKLDPTFGAVILLGSGGVTAEVMGDRVLGLPPFNERLVRSMIESLRSWPLLKGYRGRPPVHLDSLIETVIRFSFLIADRPEIQEFDINPLFVSPEGTIALDARSVVDTRLIYERTRPYAHLAIRPYPEEYIRAARLPGGLEVVLRPIRPEDEPKWMQMWADCSEETIRSRFRGLIKTPTHRLATRYCFIDYDREMAIVAEAEIDGEQRLLGVGRLVADADHEQAEYAVLVADPWQGQGLGLLLTEHCVEIARQWGIQQITAETEWENVRMLATFRKKGFTVWDDSQAGVVRAVRQLI